MTEQALQPALNPISLRPVVLDCAGTASSFISFRIRHDCTVDFTLTGSRLKRDIVVGTLGTSSRTLNSG